ncbi:MAG: hypothetical protein CMB47_00535 [Euryarchaeota archaeon]|nr:hypothetical protein [Euryarchaeota archaeon]
MAERSSLMSLALLLAPIFCLTALRTILPALDGVLSDDTLSKLFAYGFSLFVGFLMVLKYNIIEDHEYHRSKAIRKLSNSYKLEDKGLWEDSDSTIRELELKAKSNFKGKNALKSEKLMKGQIGNINNEKYDDNSLNYFEKNLEILPDKEIFEENDHGDTKTTLFSKFKSILDKVIDNAALREIDKSKNNIKPKLYSEPDIALDDKWNTSGLKRINKVVTCNSCHSLNDGETNYCGACGNYLS